MFKIYPLAIILSLTILAKVRSLPQGSFSIGGPPIPDLYQPLGPLTELDERKFQEAQEKRFKLCGETSGYEPNTYYNNKTGKCFREGAKCGSNMVIYSEEDVYGRCDCRDSSRMLIYHPQTSSCYHIFSRGYCARGEWLTLDANLAVRCTPNPCAQYNQNGRNEFVLFNSKCVELESDCGPQGQYQRVTFRSGRSISPICGYNEASYSTLGIVNPKEANCRPGGVNHIEGKCKPTIE